MLIFLAAGYSASAHPLGNFTVNHFSRVQIEPGQVRVRFVVDMAEIPTFQQLQTMRLESGERPSRSQLQGYLESVVSKYAEGLVVFADGAQVSLRTVGCSISMPPGSGGLPTLRIESDYVGIVPTDSSGNPHRLNFQDTNDAERIGWREIVVTSTSGVVIFNSTAFGTPVTDELKAYPQDMLSAPLNERKAEFGWALNKIPIGASVLRTREGRPADQTRDLFAELITAPKITPWIALLGLFVAAGLGAIHAFSPGHGKTVVGAYLVGSRGTPKHALFLGLTVTITHTAGVFTLGLITLFASHYILPESLFPILSFASGAIVIAIGLGLFFKRLKDAFGPRSHAGESQNESHASFCEHVEEHAHTGEVRQAVTHSHGGRVHSHLPSGNEGPIKWRRLLALGISGGLLPCPSALVVLLSAISLHRVGYGLALVVAFSVGLSATLTGVGLAFLYVGRFIKRPVGNGFIVRFVPVFSAFVISCVGLVICYQALSQAGLRFTGLLARSVW